MKNRFAFIIAFAALSVGTAPAYALKPKADQQDARKQMNDGKVLSLRQIESIVLPTMRGKEYLGPEYDQDSKIYRLKFVDDGRVVFVDVDARTGRTLSKR